MVYLRKSKERIEQHAKLRQPNGDYRTVEHQLETIRSYPQFDIIFSRVADRIIDCPDKDTAAVTIELQGILGELAFSK